MSKTSRTLRPQLAVWLAYMCGLAPLTAADAVNKSSVDSEMPSPKNAAMAAAREKDEALWENVQEVILADDVLDHEAVDAMAARPDFFVPRLKALFEANREDQPFVAIAAASALDRMPIPGAHDLLLGMAAHPDAKLRHAALHAASYWKDPDKPYAEGKVEAFIRALDDADPRIRRLARRVCAEFPESRDRLITEAVDLPVEDRVGVLRSLSWNKLTRAQTATVGKQLLEILEGDSPSADNLQSIVLAFARLRDSLDEETLGAARARLNDILTTGDATVVLDQQIVREYSPLADDSSLPALQRIVRDAREAAARGDAFVAIARIEGDKVFPQALAMLDDLDSRYYGFEALNAMARSENRERIVAGVLPKMDVLLGEQLARFLVAHGGRAGREALIERIGKFSPDQRMRIAWGLAGWKVEDVAADLHRSGLVPRPVDPAAIRKVRDEWAHLPDKAEVEFMTALSVLPALSFDAEADVIPCPYERAIMDFATASGGLFQPTEVRQQVTELPGEDDEEELSYVVEFTVAGKRHRFQPAAMGDWYDVGALEKAVNTALEAAGRTERFLPLDLEDQVASFVFGDPAKWAEAAARYSIPIAADGSGVVKFGKEFEDKAVEHLRSLGVVPDSVE